MGTTPGAWQTDPSGVFDERWWDGEGWTDRVRVDGRESTSAVGAAPVAAQRTAERLRAGTDPQPYAVTLTTPRPPAPTTAPVPLASSPPPPPPPPPGGYGAPPPQAPLPPQAVVVDRWAWGIVALPAILLVVLGAASGIPRWMVAVSPLTLAAMVGLMLADLRANPAITARDSAVVMVVLGAVLMPMYLFKRQRALGRGLALFWTHLGLSAVAAVASFIAVASMFSSVFLDHESIEREIELQVLAQTQTRVEVSCPPLQPATAGRTFTCTLRDQGWTTDVSVRMVDDQAFEWQVMVP